jgi:hypothetical protein
LKEQGVGEEEAMDVADVCNLDQFLNIFFPQLVLPCCPLIINFSFLDGISSREEG